MSPLDTMVRLIVCSGLLALFLVPAGLFLGCGSEDDRDYWHVPAQEERSVLIPDLYLREVSFGEGTVRLVIVAPDAKEAGEGVLATGQGVYLIGKD